jgi:hypothetical protein
MEKTEGVAMRRLMTMLAAAGVACGFAVSPAQAAPQGEVVVKTIRNESTGGSCGTYWVQATNASDTPVLKVRLLMYVWTGGDVDDTVPYRGTKNRSWVTWSMYLKPGKTVSGSIDLCATVPLQPNAVDFASFTPKSVKWTWAK